MIEFTAWPEMLAWPYLMIHGWLPYRDIAIAHTPLMLLVLAGYYKIFGLGIIQLKVFTWVLILVNLYLTFWVTKKTFNKKVAVLAAIVYLPLTLYYGGNGLWFDLALVPFGLLLFYFLKSGKYLHSGLAFGLGILTKQTFVYFILSTAFHLLQKNLRDRTEITKSTIAKIRQFILGSILVMFLMFVVLSFFGIFDDFYFWAIKFGVLYLPGVEGQISLPSVKQFLVNVFPFSISILNPAFIPWILPGIMGVYPRWELFHFQPALPFLAIALSSLIYSRKHKVIVVGYLILTSLIIGRGIYRNFYKQTRFYESDVQRLSSEIKDGNAKTLYVVNYWDSLYSLTDTTPPTKPLIPYIPWYLEVKGAKESIANDVKTDLPDAVVVNDRKNIKWNDLNNFLDRYYQCFLVEKDVELCWKNRDI